MAAGASAWRTLSASTTTTRIFPPMQRAGSRRRRERRQLLGYVGSTGYGPEGTDDQMIPHLHFGLYINDIAIDPYPTCKRGTRWHNKLSTRGDGMSGIAKEFWEQSLTRLPAAQREALRAALAQSPERRCACGRASRWKRCAVRSRTNTPPSPGRTAPITSAAPRAQARTRCMRPERTICRSPAPWRPSGA